MSKKALIVVCISKRDETKKPKVWGHYRLKTADDATPTQLGHADTHKITLATAAELEKKEQTYLLKKRFSSEKAARNGAGGAFDVYTPQELAQGKIEVAAAPVKKAAAKKAAKKTSKKKPAKKR